ncbi:Layilin [Aphelenchoides avenae]|nr:Layilin [Aphelenchus avenae]
MKLLLAAALLVPVVVAYCPFPLGVSVGESCYVLLEEVQLPPHPQTPAGSYYFEGYCKRLGGTWASIPDEETNQLIQQLVLQKPSTPFWLGARPAYDSANGVGWQWVDNSTFSYTNWAKDEPALNYGCIGVRYTGEWFADDCTNPGNFICKLPDFIPSGNGTAAEGN